MLTGAAGDAGGLALPGLAAAAGPAASAATATNTTTDTPRLPVLFVAISPSLLRRVVHARAAVSWSVESTVGAGDLICVPQVREASALFPRSGDQAGSGLPRERGNSQRTQESAHRGISDGSSTFHGTAPAAGRKPLGLLFSYGPVKGSSRWLKSQVFCVMPEQVFESVCPGQPPLSRWIAQIDSVLMPTDVAKS